MGLQEGDSGAGFILVSLWGSAGKPRPSCPSLPFSEPTVAPFSFQRQWSFQSGWLQALFHHYQDRQAGRGHSSLFCWQVIHFSLNHAPLQPHPSVTRSLCCLLCGRERQVSVCNVCVWRRAGIWKVGEWNLKLATKFEIQYNIQDSLRIFISNQEENELADFWK